MQFENYSKNVKHSKWSFLDMDKEEEKVYKAASLSIIPCATLIYKYQFQGMRLIRAIYGLVESGFHNFSSCKKRNYSTVV